MRAGQESTFMDQSSVKTKGEGQGKWVRTL